MINLLSILKNWEQKKTSDSFQVIEFFGTPGSGKTYVSGLSYEQLSKYGANEVNKLSVDIGKMDAISSEKKSTEYWKKQWKADTVLRNGSNYYYCMDVIEAEFEDIK